MNKYIHALHEVQGVCHLSPLMWPMSATPTGSFLCGIYIPEVFKSRPVEAGYTLCSSCMRRAYRNHMSPSQPAVIYISLTVYSHERYVACGSFEVRERGGDTDAHISVVTPWHEADGAYPHSTCESFDVMTHQMLARHSLGRRYG